MASLDSFPDEIIRHILLYVPPQDTLTVVQRLSHRFDHISSEPLLWRYHCRASFAYWDKEHQFPAKFAAPAATVGWKKLWISRMKKSGEVSRLFEGVLRTKTLQLEKIKQICLEGYDAKDFLLAQLRCDPTADDVLARRYYAMTILDSINRGVAIEIWSRFQQHPLSRKGLDEALGAFDMFFLHDQPQDVDYVMNTLDSLTRQFRDEHHQLREMSTRQKALALVSWLRLHNLTGMDHPELNYLNLRNCLIGHALSDENHPSLPIISSAIFCCIAHRLGVDASCCAFPSHVHAAVHSPSGQSLDGDRREEHFSETMYLDPYGSVDEVTIEDLRGRLVEFGWSQGTETFLKPTAVPTIVQRTGQSIKGTYFAIKSREGSDERERELELKRLRSGYPGLNVELAVYAIKWAELMVKQASSAHWDVGLDSFLNRFALSYSEDTWIVEKYLVPLYELCTALQPHRQRHDWENVRAIIEMLRNLDSRPPIVSRRYTQEIQQRVWFKIGQVFRHKRYHYIGIINGWALEGSTPPPTPFYMQDDLDTDLGRSKTFYTCLKHGAERLRVDQDNMDLIVDPNLVPDELMYMAGKFFKRFDRETCTFVSNMREFYPDD